MIKNIFKAIGCLSLVITTVNVSVAQENATPASVEKQKMQNIWLNNTSNAAAGVIDAPAMYSITDLGYGITKGDFKYVQEGNDNSTIKFHTEGGGIYSKMNNMFLWGDFTYQRNKIEGARFNASMYDPLRDMPFFTGDKTASKWVNQDYTIKMKAAAPKLFNFLTFGLQSSYMVAQGAKQIDPRPLVKLSKFDVGVSAVFELGKHNFIGLEYNYYSRREDCEISNSNPRLEPTLWDFVAPGFFYQAPSGYYSAIPISWYYHTNAMGGAFQYGFKNDNWNILLSGSYMQRVEDVTPERLDADAGVNTRFPLKKIGTVKEDLWEGKLVANYTFDNGNMLSLNARYTDKNVDGIEYVQIFNNEYDVQAWIVNGKNTRSNFTKDETNIKLDYMVNDGNVYKWWAGIEYANKTNNWIYYLPKSNQDVKNSIFSAFVSRHIKIKDDHSLTINVNGGFSANNEAALNYNGIKGDDEGWTMFTVKDFAFLTSDYSKFGGALTYAFSGFKSESMSMFATIDFNYYKPSASEFSKRTYTNFKIGIAF